MPETQQHLLEDIWVATIGLIRPPLYRQIEEYCRWRAVRYPNVVKGHKEVLESFLRFSGAQDTANITASSVRDYVDSLNSEYHRNQACKVIKQFLRYWYDMGTLTKEFASVVRCDNILDMKPHPLMHVEQALRVQRMVKEGLSLRQIKTRMEKEDRRVYDIHSVHRWSKYDLSGLSTGESEGSLTTG